MASIPSVAIRNVLKINRLFSLRHAYRWRMQWPPILRPLIAGSSLYAGVWIARCAVIPPREISGSSRSSFPDLGPTPKEDDVIKVADMLYENHRIDELFELLKVYQDSENSEMLWRLARAYYELSKAANGELERKKSMYEAFDVSKKALVLSEKNFACHKWYAILLDEVGKFEGVKFRLQKSPEVKDHFEKAIALNPGDPTSLHCLGYWHYSFADLAWYQRQAASAFFAAPPKSTYDEAIKSFEAAEKVQPGFYSMNLLMLGKSHLKNGNNKQAVNYLTKLKDYNAQTEEDHKAKEEGENLLKEATRKA